MDDGQSSPRLWITYPWAQREDADFAYLVPQLKEAGIRATYNPVEIRPEFHLDQWLEHRLATNNIDGLAYILTQVSVTRRQCADELTAAINRLLARKGMDFPVVGLLHGIGAQNLPPGLRVRPSFHLTDPEWKRHVASLLRRREEHPAPKEEMRFLWTVHTCYGGDPEETAIEVGPRTESIPYWRFAVPKTAAVTRWGQGPRGGGEVSPIKFSVVRGSGRMGLYDVAWFGAANGVSLTESAYAVFNGRLPEFICFGPAKGPQGPPDKMELFRFGRQGGGTPDVA